MRSTVNGLDGFNWLCGGLDYILTTDDTRFAILFVRADFKVYASTQTTVEALMSMSLEEAYRKYQEHCSKESWRHAERHFLISQAERYADLR